MALLDLEEIYDKISRESSCWERALCRRNYCTAHPYETEKIITITCLIQQEKQIHAV